MIRKFTFGIISLLMMFLCCQTSMAKGVWEVYDQAQLKDALTNHRTKEDTVRIMADIDMDRWKNGFV